jgi:hypothetical protein
LEEDGATGKDELDDVGERARSQAATDRQVNGVA